METVLIKLGQNVALGIDAFDIAQSLICSLLLPRSWEFLDSGACMSVESLEGYVGLQGIQMVSVWTGRWLVLGSPWGSRHVGCVHLGGK